jgi:hypothetical protein
MIWSATLWAKSEGKKCISTKDIHFNLEIIIICTIPKSSHCRYSYNPEIFEILNYKFVLLTSDYVYNNMTPRFK